MDTSANKQLVQHIFSELSKGNSAPFLESLADDVRWTVMGTTTWSKTFQGKQAVSTDLFRPLFAQMVEERTFSAHRFIADGEYVVVEGRGYMTTKKGQPYNNCYCWIYRISDGKMKEITEYLDTQLVASVLDPLTEA